MTNEKGWRGAITVYLSIILSAVIFLSGILMDIVRIKSAEVQVRRALDTAASSVLAGYHTKLKEDYGVFAMHQTDRVQLEETLESYMKKTLMMRLNETGIEENAYDFLKGIVVQDVYRNVNFIDLYNYRIEGIEAVPIYNFTENEIARQQMTEYMKYRAPAQFAKNVLDKIQYASSTAGLTDAYKQKTAIEKKLAKIEKALMKLQDEIDTVNRFNRQSFEAARGANSKAEFYIGLLIQKKECEARLNAEPPKTETEEEKRKEEERLKAAQAEYENAAQEADELEKQLEDELSEAMTAAQSAIGSIESIQTLLVSARREIETLKSSLNQQQQGENSKIPEVNAAFRDDIAKWERLLDSENSQNMRVKLERNLELLTHMSSDFTVIPSLVAGLRGEAGSADEVLSSAEMKDMAESARSFDIIDQVTVKAGKTKNADPRASIEKQAKQVREDVAGSFNGGNSIGDIKTLPSYQEKGVFPNKILSESVLAADSSGEGMISDINSSDISFNEDSTFSEDAFGFITDFATSLERYALDMRDEIYVNEYILAVFKDEVEIEDAGTDGKIKDTLFDKGEVEYILAGTPGEAQNHLIIKGEILLIRFGINTLHVYSDSAKRLQALELATAIAGFTGFGIPLVHNMLMCSWGMAEAFEDVTALYKGKSIPFIKTSETWQTDLVPGGYRAGNGKEREGNLMDFNYHDYLRLLLFVQNKEEKMNRIEDLIQINIQKGDPEFKLKNYNTYMKMNAEVSIKYWFLTGSFVPSRLKTSDGRHKIRVEAWKGY